ncbi:MAG: family oxidoreductase [Bacillales bacterium]|jgi:3-oxoacyl-[acyl-carrier protein] reductase|nr:family oxidoreductase [Bacillales bacterium]
MERKRFALVTGASGDIGRAIALKLAEEGYNLYLHYNQNEIAMDFLIEELRHYNLAVVKIQSDFSQPFSYKKIVDSIHDIDLLVFADGKSHYGLITDITDEESNLLIQQLLTTPFLLVKSLVPKMVSQKSGSIIFVTSIWGEVGASCEVLYSILKGGQNSFVKALSKELAPSSIRVNAVSPGAIRTKMLNRFSTVELHDISDEIPMGRLGEPNEIADVILFLSSDKSSYITGQVIGVNGGWYTK